MSRSSKMQSGYLLLENGETYAGVIPNGQTGRFDGEVVFTTGMCGYVETLTDPSYSGQIVVFTYPMIGNYGVPDRTGWESDRIAAKGVVVAEATHSTSHHTAVCSLQEWLKGQGVPLLSNVDTRALTKTLRAHGTLCGTISDVKGKFTPFSHPHNRHLVRDVSIAQPQQISEGKKRIILIDCGVKANIVRSLASYPVTILQVPYDYDFTDQEFDGICISNGPGNPEICRETLPILQKAMRKEKPIFGICLGVQLLALAMGAKTHRLPFGHRGHNQPCQDLLTQRCYITSQNHGYAVVEESLPDGWDVTFRNVNDGSVEGIAHRDLPFFAVQFHPEARPGPTDTAWLFQRFFEML